MLPDIGVLLAGLCLLFVGGEALVRGAVSLADRLGLPHLVIGLTIVGFGTSLPELLVSVQAAWDGHADIAVGNVVGSNMANILLILGISAAITPLAVRIPGIARDVAVMMAATMVMLGVGYAGEIGRGVGLAMVVGLGLYVGCTAVTGRKQKQPELTTRLPLAKEAVALLGGLAALVAGAHLLVVSSVAIARTFDVSEAVIGLTIVAVGTSLPELATAVVAAYRRHADVAIGNVVGSNIFNILGILGLTAVVRPLSVGPEIAMVNLPVMMAVSALLAVVILAVGRLNRPAGALFVVGYAAYVWSLF